MSQMLGFTEEETFKINEARRKSGMLSRLANVPFAVMRGLASPVTAAVPERNAAQAQAPPSDLAEAWVEFLIKQAEGQSYGNVHGMQFSPYCMCNTDILSEST